MRGDRAKGLAVFMCIIGCGQVGSHYTLLLLAVDIPHRPWGSSPVFRATKPNMTNPHAGRNLNASGRIEHQQCWILSNGNARRE